jgi:hypothetical protein
LKLLIILFHKMYYIIFPYQSNTKKNIKVLIILLTIFGIIVYVLKVLQNASFLAILVVYI